MLKPKIYSIVDKDCNNDVASRIYDIWMLGCIIASILPLMFVQSYPVFKITEIITVTAFIFDYAARWYTASIRLNRGWLSYLIYPFTPMAIIALPSGVITAGYLEELRELRENTDNRTKEQ